MKKYSLYIIAIPLSILIFIGFLFWQNKINTVERYGVVSRASTSGEIRFIYYDIEKDEIMDSWQGHPWFFTTAADINDEIKSDQYYRYVKNNENSVFKITGTKEKDDCEYYNDGRCLENIIVKKISVVKQIENRDEKSDKFIEEINFSGEELEKYYSSYKDPFVVHVRKALDGYLAGTNYGIDSPEITIEGIGGDTGLAAFDKDYYKSKFVVLGMYDATFGGVDVVLIFQDRPDKIFTAWVYKYHDEEEKYDFRGFWENEEETENIDEALKAYGKYIFDKEHSL